MSPNNSLVMFSVRFSVNDRAAYTFLSVPEGAYYERIFHLFLSLRVCHLLFLRCTHYTQEIDSLDRQLVLPLDQAFLPIQTRLLNLQSLVLRDCSPKFLSYLLEYLPQLEQLSYQQSIPWLRRKHPLRHADNN